MLIITVITFRISIRQLNELTKVIVYQFNQANFKNFRQFISVFN